MKSYLVFTAITLLCCSDAHKEDSFRSSRISDSIQTIAEANTHALLLDEAKQRIQRAITSLEIEEGDREYYYNLKEKMDAIKNSCSKKEIQLFQDMTKEWYKDIREKLLQETRYMLLQDCTKPEEAIKVANEEHFGWEAKSYQVMKDKLTVDGDDIRVERPYQILMEEKGLFSSGKEKFTVIFVHQANYTSKDYFIRKDYILEYLGNGKLRTLKKESGRNGFR